VPTHFELPKIKTYYFLDNLQISNYFNPITVEDGLDVTTPTMLKFFLKTAWLPSALNSYVKCSMSISLLIFTGAAWHSHQFLNRDGGS